MYIIINIQSSNGRRKGAEVSVLSSIIAMVDEHFFNDLL